jgi:hypothetical protein
MLQQNHNEGHIPKMDVDLAQFFFSSTKVCAYYSIFARMIVKESGK